MSIGVSYYDLVGSEVSISIVSLPEPLGTDRIGEGCTESQVRFRDFFSPAPTTSSSLRALYFFYQRHRTKESKDRKNFSFESIRSIDSKGNR